MKKVLIFVIGLVLVSVMFVSVSDIMDVVIGGFEGVIV